MPRGTGRVGPPRRTLTQIALPTSPFERERFWIEYVPGRSLANPVAATAEPRDSKLGELLYEPVWQSKPRVEAADLRADFLEAPATLVEYLRPRLSTLQDEHGLDAYRELLPELEVLAGAYALAGLSRLGWQPRLGERLVPGALADQLAVLPRHRRLFGRLLEMIAEDGLLQPLDGGYEVLDVPVPSDPEARRAGLLVRFPAGRVELELAGRCGRALADVLRGECDPLGLLFPGDGLLGAEQLYSDAPVAQVVNSLVAETCAAVVAELPRPAGCCGYWRSAPGREGLPPPCCLFFRPTGACIRSRMSARYSWLARLSGSLTTRLSGPRCWM